MSRKGWLLFMAISVFWGIPYLFIKIAVRELDPTVVVFARVGIAAVVLVPVALFRGTWQQLRQQWRAIVVLSCVQIVGPLLTSLLIAADPLLVALLALRFDPSERVSGLRLVGLFIGMGGVVALLGLDVGGDRQGLLGAGLVLLAAAGYAVAALLVKRPPVATLPLLGVVAAECAVTTVVLLPLAVMRLPNRVPDLEVMVSLLVLGLICTALAYLTFYALVSEVGASRGTVFTYVNPVVSVFLGVTLLGEPLNAAMVAGFILILVGSWLSTGGALPLGHLIRRGLQSEARREAGANGRDASH